MAPINNIRVPDRRKEEAAKVKSTITTTRPKSKLCSICSVNSAEPALARLDFCSTRRLFSFFSYKFAT